jgi:hypothetical protein
MRTGARIAPGRAACTRTGRRRPAARPADVSADVHGCSDAIEQRRKAALELAAKGVIGHRRRSRPVAGARAVGQGGTLLVLSAGGKGIVMRPGALRAATAKAAARLGKMRTRLASGEKPNRKRMAALAAVYDAEPAKRRPHDVITPPGGRNGTRALRPGPKARAKWLTGSVRQDPAEVIAAAFGEAEAGDPQHRRTRVVLVDGAGHQLDLIRAEAARRGVTIHVVIDLIHVLEYLWKAAWSLHEAGDPAAGTGPKPSSPCARSSARATSRSTAGSTSPESTSGSTPAPSTASTHGRLIYVLTRNELHPSADIGAAHPQLSAQP